MSSEILVKIQDYLSEVDGSNTELDISKSLDIAEWDPVKVVVLRRSITSLNRLMIAIDTIEENLLNPDRLSNPNLSNAELIRLANYVNNKIDWVLKFISNPNLTEGKSGGDSPFTFMGTVNVQNNINTSDVDESRGVLSPQKRDKIRNLFSYITSTLDTASELRNLDGDKSLKSGSDHNQSDDT